MKGGYTDNYYMQMVQNIRRYKGVRPIPRGTGIKSMHIDGRFEPWQEISPSFYDTRGDTAHRDHNGYGGNHYVNTSGRNDIVLSKVAVDRKNIYFYVETSAPLSPYTNRNWMLLLIDADNNPSTGWFGYDYIVNRTVKNATTITLMKYDASRNEWHRVADVL